MPSRYIAVDNEFNRANYPEEIGKVYDSPPGYVAVREIEDSPSEMGQAMDTWLKIECQEAGSALLNALYSARGAFEASLDLNIPQRASVAEAHIKTVLPHAITRLAELPLDLLTIDERRVIFELEEKINEGLKGLELGQVSPETIINNLASLVSITEKYLLEKVVECQCGKPGEAEPPTHATLMMKWRDKGFEAGKTETWMDAENTIKDTASRHPEIKDAWELVWADIEQWEGTDHFTINYGSGMWEDAKSDGDLYIELKSVFWYGYFDGRKNIGKDIYAIARELIEGR